MSDVKPEWFCLVRPRCPDCTERRSSYCLRKLRLDAGLESGDLVGSRYKRNEGNGGSRRVCPRPDPLAGGLRDPNAESCKALEEINSRVKRGLSGQYVRPLAVRSHWLEAVRRLGWLIGDKENGK